MRTGYVYDIECLGNTHTATFLDITTEEIKVFVINHLQDDRKEYFDFLFWSKENAAYLGFNNVGYDYPVLHKIMQQRSKLEQLEANECAIAIKKISDDIIKSEYANIRDKEILIPQVDLYLVYHYNNKNKSCSLKMLEYVMRMNNIEEMPFDHKYFIKDNSELELLVDYNIHDVKATLKFYNYSKEFIEMRKTLSSIFGFNFTNFNDPKIGEQIFLHKLAEELEIPKNEIKDRRQDVSEIDFSTIIIPELTFETKPFQALLNFYKKLKPTVEEIKGMLTDYNIAKSEISELLPYLDSSVIKVKKIKGKKTKVATKVSVLNGSISIDYGSGGAHGCNSLRTIWRKENGYTCLDIDVDGFYPNLCISKSYKPKHLGDTFIDIYKWLGNERAKYPKKHPLNLAYKLARNGCYGKTKDEHSALYAPEVTCAITINGQLLITKLYEMLMLQIPQLIVIQANTDGISVYLKEENVPLAKQICTQWENDWSLKLEYVEYETMIMRDVNNFIAVSAGFDKEKFDVNNKDDVTKKVKFKGFFEIEKDWHKNHSMKIVQKALANYFVKAIPVETTIKESTDVFDFFKVCKAKSNFKIEYWKYDKQGVKTITPMHKITRYLISNNGGQLMKVMPPIKTVADTETEKFRKTHPQQSNMFDFIEDVLVIPDRESNVEAGYLTTIHNKITSTDIKHYDINYDYYINECNKVIKAVEGNLKFEIEEDDYEQLDLFEN